MGSERRYTQKQLERIAEKELREQLKDQDTYTYSEEEVQAGLEGVGIEREQAEYAVRRYGKKREEGLETDIVKQDLKKIGEGTKIGYNHIKGFLEGIIELHFTIPSAITKIMNLEDEPGFVLALWTVLTPTVLSVGIVHPYLTYRALFESNPRLAKYVLGAQIATNVGSGIYEWVRSIRKRNGGN